MITKDKRELISCVVIDILIKRFETFPIDASNNRNAPFHEAFLKAFHKELNNKVSDVPFFISLSSWLQGLNTTLGMSFFEIVPHILSDGEKREYTSKKLGNIQIHQTQKDKINEILTNLSNSQSHPNLIKENELICLTDKSKLVNAIDFSADVFIEDKQSVTAIEMKSVKPNSGEMRGEKQKILEGKAALYKLFPKKKVDFFLGFPFDPTNETPTGFNKKRFLGSIINMTKYFDPDETLVASELWDYLSGVPKTMESVLEIINLISTPEFLAKLKYLTDNNNRDNKKYPNILEEWSLYTELELITKNKQIQTKIKNDGRLQRIYNQQTFTSDGYNRRRATILKETIS